MLITDSDSILGAGRNCKKFLGRTFTPLQISEPDKHNKNTVKRVIHNLKAGCSKIRNACGMGVVSYH